jgi:23S rRNA (uracil1939-C5)-methyltransferase
MAPAVQGPRMPTYREIQDFVQRHHGFIPKAGWIAHVKVLRGVPTRRAANRAGRGRRVEPCPPEKREAIEQAFRHFGLI